MGDYVTIYTTTGKITIHTNLKALESKLPSSMFMRVHRSFMISLLHLQSIEENKLQAGTTTLPIGEAFRSKLIKRLKIIR